jgi:hypothetical protein
MLQPCGAAAADADENGVIQTFDAALTARFATGLPPFNNSDFTGQWRFEPPFRTYLALNSHQANQDYSATLLGDVDGSWTPATTGLSKTGGDFQTYDLLANVAVRPGEILHIPFTVTAGEQATSADIDFSYNPQILRFVEVSKTALSAEFEIIVNAQEGRVRAAAYSITPVKDSGDLLSLVFEVIGQKNQPGTITLNRFQVNNLAVKQGSRDFMVGEQLPAAFALHQNYPNPFNPETTIRFDIPALNQKTVKVKLAIYNITGQLVRVLVDEERSPGAYEMRWDGNNEFGSRVATGMYFYRITAGDFSDTKKMLLLR